MPGAAGEARDSRLRAHAHATISLASGLRSAVQLGRWPLLLVLLLEEVLVVVVVVVVWSTWDGGGGGVGRHSWDGRVRRRWW